MDIKDIEKFDPTVAELTKMVKATAGITATDLEDPAQLAIVRENRIALKKARVQVQKRGKELREDALAYQRAVIEKEKELVGIIEPEEERLERIETEAKELAIRKDRLEKLPVRKERIAAAGLDDFHDRDDEGLLMLDANEFEAYFNELGAKKLEHDREETERKAREEEEARAEAARKEQEERDRIAAEKQAEQDAKQKELDEKEAKLAEERRAIDHEKEVKAAEERARAEEQERQKREKEQAEAETKAEAARKAKEKKELEKREAYIAFLKEHGYTKATAKDFHTEETEDAWVLYKKVGSFKK